MCPNKGKKKVSKAKVTPVEAVPTPTTDHSSTCCVPRGQVSCPSSDDILDQSSAIRILCSNPQCPQSGLMHQKCFDKFETLAVLFLSKHARCRDWSHKHKLSSLWINRGYDLIFKMCACDCGHGHVKRDLEFVEAVQEGVEGAAAVHTDHEKKKKKKSEVKPKLNYPKDRVSEKSIGSFNYNKQCKSKKSLEPLLDNFDADDFVDDSSIPGLKPSRTPLTLNLGLSVLNSRGKINKAKKTPLPLSSSIEEDDGWTTVSKGLGRKENRIADNDVPATFNHSLMLSSEINLKNIEESVELYQSDDDIFENLPDKVFLYRRCAVDANSCVNSCGTKVVKKRAVDEQEEQLSDLQLEEMLGNLVEEKLVEEISKKKALEKVKSLVEHSQSISNAFSTEREKLQQNIQFLNQSNMELRETSEAGEFVLQMEIDELKTALNAEVHTKNAVLEQNEYLNRLVQCVESDKLKSVAALEVARKECEEQIVKATEIVKAHEQATLQMLENEKMKLMTSVEAMEARIRSLSSTVDTLRDENENVLMKNLLTEDNLENEKKLVRNLREQMKTERESDVNTILEAVLEVLKLSTRKDMSTIIFQQILKKLKVAQGYDVVREQCQDQKNEVKPIFYASQSTYSSEAKEVTSGEGSLMMEMLEIAREEAAHTHDKVEMLENTVKTLQQNQMLMERNLTNSRQMDITSCGDKRLRGMKKKVLELVKDCDLFDEMSKKMVGDQDIAHQQICTLNSGVDLQILDNKSLRDDFARLEKKMGAFEHDMKCDRKERQSWAACNWL